MAVVYKCDACGEYYDGDENGYTHSITFSRRKPINDLYVKGRGPYDLCPKCFESIEDLFHKNKEEEEQ